VQFSASVNSAGAPVFRIGGIDATTVNLEDCLGCGLQGWGWQDNGWGGGVMGPLVYFSNTGPQTIRVQVREDGMLIDQMVLSPLSFLSSSPGALTNDTTILPESSGLSVSTIGSIAPNSGSAAGGTSIVISGTGFTEGATVRIGGVPATSVQVVSSSRISAVTANHLSGSVDVVVTNADGRSATLLGGFTYVSDVALLYPNGGETLKFDAMFNIQWVVPTGIAARQDVYLSLNSGATWTVLATGLPGTVNGFMWRVPRIATANARIKVRVWNAAGEYVDDTSDRDFSIQKKPK